MLGIYSRLPATEPDRSERIILIVVAILGALFGTTLAVGTFFGSFPSS